MSATALNELFALPDKPLPEDVLNELSSISRIHSLSEQELFFKWEAYSMKLGIDNHTLTYKTVRDFKKDVQEAHERESRGKMHMSSASKRGGAGTPRGDVYGVLNDLVSGAGTPAQGAKSLGKRKSAFETPSGKVAKTPGRTSPTSEQKAVFGTDAGRATPFHSRPNPGHTVESINSHIPLPTDPVRPAESRVKLKANTELAKFNYKPMAMKLSEASEILDDRLDEFAILVQEHHGLSDAAFGNPAAQGTADIVTVGRIASDSEGKMNSASLVLETSRRMGAGMRVPLQMAAGLKYDFFPGKIVALRGTNPAGEYFSVTEILSIPLMSLPASKPAELDVHHARVQGAEDAARPLNIIVASGPYTPDSDLEYAALDALLDRAVETCADVVLLNGPFLDVQHPLIATGDFELPADYPVSPDRATLSDAFGAFISRRLGRLVERLPCASVILVPSVRDAVCKHVAWPQDRLAKKELSLPKQVTCVTNPITLSINEIVVGISSQDVLYEMQRQTVAASGDKTAADDLLARLSANLIQQRHFFPVFPPLAPESLPKPASVAIDDSLPTVAVGANLDIPYLKLGDWLQVRPDVVITPSMLTPFAKIVESTVVINPGELSKRRAPGTYAQMTVLPRREQAESVGVVGHELYDRARVDIVRI